MEQASNLVKNSIKKTAANTSWQMGLIHELDEMVDSFLGFPASVPQTFRDYQLARHLLWKLSDNQRHFRRLLMKGIRPQDLDIFWLRLMPYITGDLSESLSPTSPKVIQLSLIMYDIVRDVVIDHRSNLDHLMDKVVEVIRSVRSIAA